MANLHWLDYGAGLDGLCSMMHCHALTFSFTSGFSSCIASRFLKLITMYKPELSLQLKILNEPITLIFGSLLRRRSSASVKLNSLHWVWVLAHYALLCVVTVTEQLGVSLLALKAVTEVHIKDSH